MNACICGPRGCNGKVRVVEGRRLAAPCESSPLRCSGAPETPLTDELNPLVLSLPQGRAESWCAVGVHRTGNPTWLRPFFAASPCRPRHLERVWRCDSSIFYAVSRAPLPPLSWLPFILSSHPQSITLYARPRREHCLKFSPNTMGTKRI